MVCCSLHILIFAPFCSPGGSRLLKSMQSYKNICLYLQASCTFVRTAAPKVCSKLYFCGHKKSPGDTGVKAAHYIAPQGWGGTDRVRAAQAPRRADGGWRLRFRAGREYFTLFSSSSLCPILKEGELFAFRRSFLRCLGESLPPLPFRVSLYSLTRVGRFRRLPPFSLYGKKIGSARQGERAVFFYHL